MRWDAYAMYALACVLLLIVCLMCGFAKEFFSLYAGVGAVLTIIQFVVIILMICIAVFVYFQYKKTGTYIFYDHGFKHMPTGKVTFYNDIITYEFVADSNKVASELRYVTDTQETGTLTALLPNEAFSLFQHDHAKIWAPFIIGKINAKELYTFVIQDDVTSFKMSLDALEYMQKEVVFSHQGLVVYNQFVRWEEIAFYNVSWTGMFKLVDTQHRTIFLEPMTTITNYAVFLKVLEHFVGGKHE